MNLSSEKTKQNKYKPQNSFQPDFEMSFNHFYNLSFANLENQGPPQSHQRNMVQQTYVVIKFKQSHVYLHNIGHEFVTCELVCTVKMHRKFKEMIQ